MRAIKTIMHFRTLRLHITLVTVFIMCANTPTHALETALRRTLSSPNSKVSSVLFSSDGSLLCGISDGAILVWNTKTGRKLCTIRIGREKQTPNGAANHLYKAAFSPNSKMLVTATGWIGGIVPTEGLSNEDVAGWNKGKVQLWDARTGQLLHTLTRNRGATNDFEDADFSSDGKTLAVVGGGKIELWAAESGKFKQSLAASDYMRSAKFSSDGRLLLGGGAQTEWSLWEVQTGKVIHRLEDAKSAYNFSFSRDGQAVRAMCWVNKQSYIYIPTFWSTRTGKITRTLPGPVSLTQFSTDGERLAGEGDKAANYDLQLYNGRSGKVIRTFIGSSKGDSPDAFAFSPDSKLLTIVSGYAAAKGELLFFDAKTGVSLRSKTRIYGEVVPLMSLANIFVPFIPMTFSPIAEPKGSSLAVINRNGSVIRLWRIKP